MQYSLKTACDLPRVCLGPGAQRQWSTMLASAVVVVVMRGIIAACFCTWWSDSVSQMFSRK